MSIPVHISNYSTDDYINKRYTVSINDQHVSIPEHSLDAVTDVLDLVGAEVTKRISLPTSTPHHPLQHTLAGSD